MYAVGTDPDYRFSFANERTFLAWIRTALALIAGGVGLNALHLSIPHGMQHALAAVLVVLGVLCAGGSWLRWAASERAIRRADSLPPTRIGLLLAGLVAMVGVTLVVIMR